MSQVEKPEKKENAAVDKSKPAAPRDNKGAKKRNETDSRRYKFREWKKDLVVTLETEIPELPKKGDRLTQPVRKDHDGDLERIEQDIQKTLKQYVPPFFLLRMSSEMKFSIPTRRSSLTWAPSM